MTAPLNNLDIKDTNNKVLRASDPATGREELRYVVSELGATFGRVKTNMPVVWRVQCPTSGRARKFLATLPLI
jgi:hypothetical protein